MKTILNVLLGLLLGYFSYSTTLHAASDGMFLIRSTAKAPAAVVEALEDYAQREKWLFLGANRVKKGQVTLVKICIPEVGRQVWPVGLHLSAMLPCGNLGIYQKQGQTEISLLNPRYMHVLYPHPAIERASATAAALLTDMLDVVAAEGESDRRVNPQPDN